VRIAVYQGRVSLGRRGVVVVGLVCLMGAACAGNETAANVASSSFPSASSSVLSSPTESATTSAVPSQVDVPHDCAKPASKLEVSALNASWIGPNGKPAKPGALCLSTAADDPFTVTLHNDVHGEGITFNHTFSIDPDPSATDELFYGDLVYPGESVTYQVPSLAAGVYVFKCDIHPQTMTGVLVVE
jgi:hypothetical protein